MDLETRLNKLINMCGEDTGSMLKNAYDTLTELRDIAKNGNSKHIVAYEKKKKALEDMIGAFEISYGMSYFKTIIEVGKYLTSQGYVIADRTLYEHKKQGKFVGVDAGYLKKDIDDYASKYLRRKDDDTEGLTYAEKKAKAEAEYKEIKTEKEKIAIDEAMGRLIDRDIVAREFAGRIELIKRYLEDFVSSVPSLLEGKTEKEIRDILKDKIDYVFIQYSNDLEILK